MVCKDFFDLLDNYESLNENQHNELELHAQSCENCRNELEFFKSIILTSRGKTSANCAESAI